MWYLDARELCVLSIDVFVRLAVPVSGVFALAFAAKHATQHDGLGLPFINMEQTTYACVRAAELYKPAAFGRLDKSSPTRRYLLSPHAKGHVPD